MLMPRWIPTAAAACVFYLEMDVAHSAPQKLTLIQHQVYGVSQFLKGPKNRTSKVIITLASHSPDLHSSYPGQNYVPRTQDLLLSKTIHSTNSIVETHGSVGRRTGDGFSLIIMPTSLCQLSGVHALHTSNKLEEIFQQEVRFITMYLAWHTVSSLWHFKH